MTRRAAVMMLACALVPPASAQTAAPPANAERAPVDEHGPASKGELFEPGGTLLQPGTNVYLEDMVVRAKSGVMMRVSDGKREIFVAPIDPSSLQYVAVGSRIDIRGTLVEAPSRGQAMLEYAMNSREARRLARHRVYVDAWSLTSR